MSIVLNIALHNGQVEHFYQEWKSGSLKLNPDFQRSNLVWDKTRKARLIESLIVGFPVPPIFLVEAEDTREVVDGLQRMTAIFEYLDGKYALQNLDFAQKINGLKFDDLPPKVQVRIKRASLGYYVLPSDNPHWGASIKHIMFDRLNQGVPVNPIERIMGSHPGPGNDLVRELGASILDMWKDRPARVKSIQRRGKHYLYALAGIIAVQANVEDDRLSIDGKTYRRGGKNPWEALLVSTLKRLNKLDADTRADIKETVVSAMTTAMSVFSHPFQTWDANKGRYNSALNDAALILQTWGCNRFPDLTADQWESIKDSIEQRWKDLCSEYPITHKANALRDAMAAWGKMIEGLIDDPT